MESTDLSALRQTTSILCLRLGTPTRYRLARESHQDGGHHFHAYLGFESAVRIRSASRLDFGQHHPNIQSVRTGHRRTWDYVGKDGDIVYEIGDPPDPIGGPSGGRGDSVWSEAVRAESEEEFYSILRDGAPRYYILYHRQLEQYAAKFYGVRPQPYESPTFTDLTDRELPNGRARRLSETTEEDTDGEV